MKTKTILGIVAVVSLLTAGARAQQLSVGTVTTNGLSEPYNVVEDANGNIYISDSANNRILRMDAGSQAMTPLGGAFDDPQGLLLTDIGGTKGLLVTDTGNSLIRFVRLSDGNTITLAGQLGGGPAVNAAGRNAAFRYPVGLAQDAKGNVYIADWGNNTIRVLNLDDPALGVTNLVVSGTTFYRPTAVAFAGNNQLWVADTGNNKIKLITLTTPTTGTLTTTLGSGVVGSMDSPIGSDASFRSPRGLLWLEGVGLLVSDTGNNTIRLATNNPTAGSDNYAVITLAGVPGTSGAQDGAALSATFNGPVGLCEDGANNAYLIADLANDSIRSIQNGAPPPPVANPAIGWVESQVVTNSGNTSTISVLRTNTPFVLNNDVTIAIAAAPNVQTHYTYGPTPTSPLQDNITDPSSTVGITPPYYKDGEPLSQVPATIVLPQPDLTVKAISYASQRHDSAIVSAEFRFVAATPNIVGDNAANFKVTDATANAEMWYTLDGSDPTNGPPSMGPLVSGQEPQLQITNNVTFKVRAFRLNYAVSSVASKVFSITNYAANKITFGFSSGEASSDFVASPGQYFFAPVTLSLLPNQTMYSLQFNVTVTNLGPDPVTPGAVVFRSMLMKPIPNSKPVVYTSIPPAMFTGLLTQQIVVTNVIGTNSIVSTNTIYEKEFKDLLFTNTIGGQNLLGVGWLERFDQTNLYDTTHQDLIQYSQAHDVMHQQQDGKVIVGGYAFQVPADATANDTYQIQIGRPSATSDGIGAPGSAVNIDAPTNGALQGGAINSMKNVTIGARKYLVGDAYPFRWFNAGDFGDSNLVNADVEQVFQSAIYHWNAPPSNSDFFDAMDSCGAIGVLDPNTGYYTNAGAANPNPQVDLYDGNDTNINQIMFGDKQLNVCDVYVTFRRSLDPSLKWFRRFWLNGERVAQPVPNVTPHAVVKPADSIQPKNQVDVSVSSTNAPEVNFGAGASVASPGQTVQIPITARIFGDYSLKVLMLNLTVDPLDGSPPLDTSIQFTPNPALGTPTLTDSTGAGNFADAWLNSSITGLSGTATVGTLTVTLPTNAPSTAAYAIHFDEASGSPNGLAVFPDQTRTGLITLSDRSTSSYGDGIPDSWRLRYFGTVNNVLSQAKADADGDGVDNWQEYVAGTDPMDPKSCLKLSSVAKAPQGKGCLIHWPSVAGKQYVIERSDRLFNGKWTPVSTNDGTGSDMEFQDNTGGSVHFYRVRVLP